MSRISQIPLSVLDLSPVIEGSTPADAFRSTLDLAKHTESLGYGRYWVAEHHNMPGIASAATSVLIGYIAAGTSTIRVGAGGIMLPNHAPIVIAEQFGTLESMFPGRIDLGLGRAPGTDRPTAHALRRTLHSDGDDFPKLLAELQYFFQPVLAGQKVQAVPGGGLSVPIWLLGSSDFSARLAAQLGMRFSFAAHFSPENTLPALDIYRRNFRPSKDLKEPYAMVAINVFAADSTEEAQRLATSQQQSFLNLIRGVPGKIRPPVDDMDTIWSEPEKALVTSRVAGSIIGDREVVKAGLDKFAKETMADELMINGIFYDHAARLRSYEIVADAWHGRDSKAAGK